jgi:DNA polymerase-3 subunit epsilon
MRYTITNFADMPLYDLPVAVFDFETTGVDPDNDKVVEVAVVHFNLGTSVPQVVYNKRINPGVPIPEGASKVHGITDIHVDGCSPFGDCWSEIDEVLQGRVLAAYNLPFDWTLLAREYQRMGNFHPGRDYVSPYSGQFFGIDGFVLAKWVDSHIRGKGVHRLGSVCKRRNIEINAHEASSDALATAHLITQLLTEISRKRNDRFPTFRDFWGWQKSVAIEQEAGLRGYFKKKDIKKDFWPWTDL